VLYDSGVVPGSSATASAYEDIDANALADGVSMFNNDFPGGKSVYCGGVDRSSTAVYAIPLAPGDEAYELPFTMMSTGTEAISTNASVHVGGADFSDI
jgi:hypothetical protein